MRALVSVAIALTAAVVAIVTFPVFLQLRSGGTKVFEPQVMDDALLASLASAALLFGVLAIFSIGLASLPAGIVLLLLLFRALRRRPLEAT